MPELHRRHIGPTGYNLMGLTWGPTPVPQDQAFEAMRAAVYTGCYFWSAGEFYGTPEVNSLTLINAYFTKYPNDIHKVVLSVKGGLKGMVPDGAPEGIQESVDNCLRLLDGKKGIDIFEVARVDKNVPIETTMKALVQYAKERKIGGIALSGASAATIQRAAKVGRITAVEMELSFWKTDIFSNGVAEACSEHGITIVAYSPTSRGMFTGEITKPEDIPEGDFRHLIPRFWRENFDGNLKLVQELQRIAKKKGCSPAQLAIGWVMDLSMKNGNPVIIPIVGASTAARVEENAWKTKLSGGELTEIDEILEKFDFKGTRFSAHALAMAEG